MILYIFVGLGFLLGKTKVVKSEHSKILSTLLVYVFLCSNIFKTFSGRFSPAYLAENYKMLLTSAGTVIALFFLSNLAARLFSKKQYERNLYEYSLLIPNYGYIGYTLAEALLGQTGLINAMTFSVPVSLYTYTVGFAKLTKQGTSLKKLINPVIITTFVGILVGLTGIPVPQVLNSVLDKASSCIGPVSMLLMGIVISDFSLKDLLTDVKTYIVVALRLVGIPLLVGGVLSLFCETSVVQTAVLFFAVPCGMNTVVFPKLVDENCKIGASIAMISTALSCLTLPIVLSIFHIG